MAWQEITSRRTLYGRHYAQGTKRRYETVMGTPLAYDDGGTLTAVDMRAQRVDNAQLDGWLITANGWHYALGQPAGKTDGWVGFGGKQGSYWVLNKLIGAGHLHWPTKEYNIITTANYDRANLSRQDQALPLADGDDTVYASSRATWADVMPGVDLSWHMNGRSLKEEINISAPARAALESPATPDDETYAAMIFELDTIGIPMWAVRGLPRSLDMGFDDSTGPIELRDEVTELISFMPIDYAYLAAPPAPPDLPPALRLRKRMFRKDGKDYLIVGARVDDLKAFPAGAIIFDPTYTTQPAASAGKDSSIRKDNPTANYGTSTSIYLHYDTVTYDRKGVIEFDLSSLPSSYSCDSAALTLTSNSDYQWGTGQTITVHSLAADVADWVEVEITYNVYKSGTNWPGSAGANTSGTDYEATALGSALGPGGGGSKDISLTAARVEGWFGSTNTNYGMILTLDTNWAAVISSDHATASYRPKLVVEYSEAAPDPIEAIAEAHPLGSTAEAVGTAVDPGVLVASIPPIALITAGNLFLNTQGGQLSAMLLMTHDAKWVLTDSAGDPCDHGLCIVRKRAYLVPQ